MNDAKPTVENQFYGRDCPQGMVQVEFVGCDPKNKLGNYGWKPETSAFLELWVDGKRFRVELGDCYGSTRRGLHIVTESEVTVAKTATNSVSIFI